MHGLLRWFAGSTRTSDTVLTREPARCRWIVPVAGATAYMEEQVEKPGPGYKDPVTPAEAFLRVVATATPG